MKFSRDGLWQWPSMWILGIALFIRLALAPFPGFYGDTNTLVQYVRVLEQQGLAGIKNMTMSELYPAGFLYHAWIVGHGLKNKLRSADEFDTSGMTAEGASVAERMGARAFPMAYDLLIGAALLLIISRYVSARAGTWAAAIYLFNPGAIMNSSLWNYDSMFSFYLLLVVFFAGLALAREKDFFWMCAWATAGAAISIKLQGAMVLPFLGLISLLTGRVKPLVLGPLVMLATVAVIYAPFVAGHQWLYLRRVFVDSFHSYPVTHAGAFNLWGLGYQRPVTNRFAGLTYESIGRGLLLVAYLWLMWQLWKQRALRVGGEDALRRVAVAATYAFAGPFILLTRMHERYLAPAIAVCVLAGMLDRRMRGVMWGFSAGYAINLAVVLLEYGMGTKYQGELRDSIHVSISVIRFACCLLNLGSFVFLAWRLPEVLRPAAVTEPGEVPAPKSGAVMATAV